jgi:hypothetical protein
MRRYSDEKRGLVTSAPLALPNTAVDLFDVLGILVGGDVAQPSRFTLRVSFGFSPSSTGAGAQAATPRGESPHRWGMITTVGCKPVKIGH